MTSNTGILRAINGFLELLMAKEIAVDYVPMVLQHTAAGGANRVTWADSLPEVFSLAGLDLSDYILCVKERQYCALLYDGSFLQITFDVDGYQELRGHRLVFWPSPFKSLNLREFPADGAYDVIAEYHNDLAADGRKVQLRGPWRFDFDPNAATDAHPETHLTVLHSECRLPGTRPLDLRRFCVLVFQHLHVEHYDGCEEWAEAVPKVPKTATLATVNDEFLHIHWRNHY